MMYVRLPSLIRARCYKCKLDLVFDPMEIKIKTEPYDIYERGEFKEHSTRTIDYITCPYCKRDVFVSPENVVEYRDIPVETYRLVKDEIKPIYNEEELNG